MNSALFLAVFLLSPFSFSKSIPIELNNQTIYVNRAVYERIERPDTSEDSIDVNQIEALSYQMPFLYEKKIGLNHLPFRTLDAYRRLLNKTDIQSNLFEQKHTFFIFRDNDGEVQGYVHGWVDKKSRVAMIDELVVEKSFQERGVAKALLVRLLKQYHSEGIPSKIMARSSYLKEVADRFNLELVDSDFETTFIVDHLLARFSVNYFKYRGRRVAPKHQTVAEELELIISRARERDSFSVNEAMEYLDRLASQLEVEIERKKGGENYYYGIQFDQSDLANIYFMMTVLSVLSKEDMKRSSVYYEYRGTYLALTVKAIREAQIEGGLYPLDLQLSIARLYAFIRFLYQNEKGSAEEIRWVQRSIGEYLKMITLNENRPKGTRGVFLSPGYVEVLVREILWFQYEYRVANELAKMFMKKKQLASTFLRKEENKTLSEEDKELRVIQYFSGLQKEVWEKKQIELSGEFGLLFLYLTDFYSLDERVMRDRLGEVFSLATFYNTKQQLEFAYISILEASAQNILNAAQVLRLEELIRYFTRPFDKVNFLTKQTVVSTSI